ncbi:MAG: apolipoprotein N-acyltransferase, partial [Myxococcales bacterium]|nr:apolipoprotein N-acyltransferase [Myxococcales bacterium]
ARVSKKKRADGGDVIDFNQRKKAKRPPRPPLFTRPRLVKAGVSALAGTLLFLSCATFDIWPFTWFAVAPLLAVALHPSTRKPAVYGFITGLFANGGGFYWIVPFLQRFGHLPLVAAIPIFLLLVSYQAITFSLFAWAVRRLDDRFAVGVTFLAPIVYVACELVVPYVFPWYLAITQAWVRPVIQIADLTGPLGVSFLLVLCNGAIYDACAAWRGKQPIPLPRVAIAVGILAASLGYGLVRIDQVSRARAAAPKLKIGVVQANIGIHEKWNPSLAHGQLAVHQEVAHNLAQKGADLVVWPESSYPYYFGRDQSHDWPESDPRRAQHGFSTPLLFGTLTADTRSPYPFNSALLIDKDGDVRGTFDKNILMVFGEYIPYYEQLKFIKQWIPETSNWGRGTDVSVFPLQTPKGVVRLGPMICYEDIFPSFARRLIKRDPNILINITNDAWFGRTSEPYEHLALAVYRSVESRLDLVRAVNTGVSAYVDATGRVYDKSPSVDPDETPDAKPVGLLDDVAVMQPFKVYATLGEWFGALCLLAAVVLGLWARARGGQPVRWRLVLGGAVALAVTTIVLAAVFCGPGHLRVVFQLLTHRKLGVDADVSFDVGVHLLPAVTIACLAAGVVVARMARTPKGERGPRLELAMAVMAFLVVPALLFGTLEGEQAGLVISALLAIGLAFFAGRLYRRFPLGS